MIDVAIKLAVARNWVAQGGKLPEHEGTQYAESRVDDAFSTVMQWLHSRIPFTRGEARPAEKLYLPLTVGSNNFAYPTTV